MSADLGGDLRAINSEGGVGVDGAELLGDLRLLREKLDVFILLQIAEVSHQSCGEDAAEDGGTNSGAEAAEELTGSGGGANIFEFKFVLDGQGEDRHS